MKIRSKKQILCALSALLLAGCGFEPVGEQTSSELKPLIHDATTAASADTTTEITTTTAPPEPEDPSVRVVAVGDNLVQKYVYTAAQNWATDGTYDFTKCYENVADVIALGDIRMINQETLIANDQYEISGSNFNFNSPTQLGDALMDVGFNVITMANNHMLDKGIGGLLATLDYWDGMQQEHDVTVVGAYRDAEDMSRLRTMEINGMTVAFLAYTEHINGYSVPADSPVEIVLTSEVDVMQQQIESAKRVADAVIVSVHWGVEDTHYVPEERKMLAQDMVSWGADVIVGTHTHTAETMEYITREDGTQGFVFYSLGNFISAQTDNFNCVGEMADFTLTVDLETCEVIVSDVQIVPVITHYDDGRFKDLRLYPYYMYTSELADSHGLPVAPLGTAKTFSMDVINRIIDENIPKEFQQLGVPEGIVYP